MKMQKLIFATVWIFISIAFFACQEGPIEETDLVAVTDPGAITNNTSLFGENSVRDQLRGFGIGGPMGLIYGRFTSTASGRSDGTTSILRLSRATMSNSLVTNSNARVATDSTETEWEEESCWVETYTETDNSYEFILDFGDGCYIDGEFMKGKMIERGTFTDGSFTDEIEYFEFGGKDWEIVGTERFEGTWMEHETDSAIWEADYSFVSDLRERFTEGDEVIEVDYRASGSEHIDNDGLTVSTNDELVSTSEGETYESHVEEPLYLDFSCEDDEIFVFVRGLEVGEYSYTEDEVTITGTYSIDFGDGTCDNLVTVTEDGESEEIDVAEEWEREEYEDDCDDEEHGDDKEDDESEEGENEEANDGEAGENESDESESDAAGNSGEGNTDGAGNGG